MPVVKAKPNAEASPASVKNADSAKKRRAEDEEACGSKKAKIEVLVLEEEDDQENEEEDNDALSEDLQERLERLASLVEGLTKSYLKEVMRELPGFYGRGSGTNREMAAEIVGHLEQCARDGGDLMEEMELVERVDQSCYGQCGYD